MTKYSTLFMLGLLCSCEEAYDTKLYVENTTNDTIIVAYKDPIKGDSTLSILPQQTENIFTDRTFGKMKNFDDCCPCILEEIKLNGSIDTIGNAQNWTIEKDVPDRKNGYYGTIWCRFKK